MGQRRTASRHARVVSAVALLAITCGGPAGVAQGSGTEPPKISVSRPKDGSVVTEPTVTLVGNVKVAPFNGPSPHVTATLNGKALKLDVAGPTEYEIRADVSLEKGPNELTIVVNDGNGGESSKTITVRYAPVLPTKRQCVSDKRGDSRDHFTHMDIVRTCATRRGGKVIFTVTTAKAPPHIHDGFGNPAAPCLEIPRVPPGHGGPAPLQTCGDAVLRGYTMHFWPKVPFGIHGRVSTWRVPLKYLPKKSFEWRAYVADGNRQPDRAPDKGFLAFVVK